MAIEVAIKTVKQLISNGTHTKLCPEGGGYAFDIIVLCVSVWRSWEADISW